MDKTRPRRVLETSSSTSRLVPRVESFGRNLFKSDTLGLFTISLPCLTHRLIDSRRGCEIRRSRVLIIIVKSHQIFHLAELLEYPVFKVLRSGQACNLRGQRAELVGERMTSRMTLVWLEIYFVFRQGTACSQWLNCWSVLRVWRRTIRGYRLSTLLLLSLFLCSSTCPC